MTANKVLIEFGSESKALLKSISTNLNRLMNPAAVVRLPGITKQTPDNRDDINSMEQQIVLQILDDFKYGDIFKRLEEAGFKIVTIYREKEGEGHG